MAVTRRAILVTSVTGVAGLTLAACATDPQLAETTSPSGTVDQTPEAALGEVMLAMSSAVMVGSGAKFMIDDALTILVTQPIAGVFKAFNASCTHAGCIVNGVQDNQIACGCHGARFDVETGGVLAGPARQALGKINLEVRGEELWVII
jgi:Rieske Fe-S protein